MPGLDGYQVLDLLKGDPATQSIPVVILSSQSLTLAERARLTAAHAILAKEFLGRATARDEICALLKAAGVLEGVAAEAAPNA
jgi:CheY-like chemotaxis protein